MSSSDWIDLVDTNEFQKARVRAQMIHYCYGDKTWEKRNFVGEQAGEVWFPKTAARKGTILGELLSQIIAARTFYAGAHFDGDLIANQKSQSPGAA